MTTPFQQYDASAWGAVAITPTDGEVITTGKSVPFRGLYVGVTGNVSVRMLSGVTVTFEAVPAGTTLDIQFDMVNATGTTANSLLGLF